MGKKSLIVIVGTLVVILLVGILTAVFLHKSSSQTNGEGNGVTEGTKGSEEETENIFTEDNEWEFPRDEKTSAVAEETEGNTENTEETRTAVEINSTEATEAPRGTGNIEETQKPSEGESVEGTKNTEDQEDQDEEPTEAEEESTVEESEPTSGAWLPGEDETPR